MRLDSCPCGFQSKTCLAPTSWAARILLRAEPTPTRTRGHLKTSLRGGQGGTLLPTPLPPSSLLEAARAQNFPRFHHPSPFSPNYSPLSLLPAPHLHIPPLITLFPLTLSAPVIFNLIAIRELARDKDMPDIDYHDLPIPQSKTLPLQNRGGHARQRGNFSNFRIKALHALRNSHLDPLSPYFNKHYEH